MNETAAERQPLACPHCGHGESLWSDEPASIMYTIKMYRDGDGIEVEYTGAGHEAQDEGTEYVGDIWCRSCGTQLTEVDFGIDREHATTPAGVSDGVTLTREQLSAWAGRQLTDSEIAELDTAISNSSIPEAISVIADNLP